MILAGDIGGTHTRLALFERGSLRLAASGVYPSREHRGVAEIATRFIAEQQAQVATACFGIAGPIVRGRVETPNLAWVVDATQLAGALGLRAVHLINDLEANAYGIAALAPSDFVVLNEGAAQPLGNRALISAGTGLGEAGLIASGSGHRPFPSEGGHADFAPRNQTEIELLRYLVARFGHVSYERVLSGPGLCNIYRFLRDTDRAEEPAWLAARTAGPDAAAVITDCGLAGTAGICAQALEMFVSFYGAEAGNLALKVMALGGVFLGGGIAPRILPKLRGPGFLQAFTDKGRLGKVLAKIPVRVITNENTGLLGAASAASSAANERE